MDVHFSLHDLPTLDQLKTEALCLPFFSDERPLRGAPGLIDWRLCGRISEHLVSGRMRGELGEAVLMPARPRLMAERLVWLGVGPRAEFGDRVFRTFVRDLMRRLVDKRVRSVAVVFPGRVQGTMDAARAMEWFLDEAEPLSRHIDEVVVLDTQDAHRAMQPLVDRARRRALSDLL
jgi:hypothetical protein